MINAADFACSKNVRLSRSSNVIFVVFVLKRLKVLFWDLKRSF